MSKCCFSQVNSIAPWPCRELLFPFYSIQAAIYFSEAFLCLNESMLSEEWVFLKRVSIWKFLSNALLARLCVYDFYGPVQLFHCFCTAFSLWLLSEILPVFLRLHWVFLLFFLFSTLLYKCLPVNRSSNIIWLKPAEIAPGPRVHWFPKIQIAQMLLNPLVSLATLKVFSLDTPLGQSYLPTFTQQSNIPACSTPGEKLTT